MISHRQGGRSFSHRSSMLRQMESPGRAASLAPLPHAEDKYPESSACQRDLKRKLGSLQKQNEAVTKKKQDRNLERITQLQSWQSQQVEPFAQLIQTVQTPLVHATAPFDVQLCEWQLPLANQCQRSIEAMRIVFSCISLDRTIVTCDTVHVCTFLGWALCCLTRLLDLVLHSIIE